MLRLLRSMHSRIRTLAIVLALPVALTACSTVSQTPGSDSVSSGSKGKRSKSGKQTGKDLPGEVARLNIERDRLAQANVLLEQELAEAHEDLRRVEQQLVVYEENLVSEQGKATAVAASAEARIRSERVARERPDVLSDSTRAYVTSLIETSESLIRKQNYAAALFFAERANHTMNTAERRANIEGAATTRAVSVSAANLREGPGQDYAVIERLSIGAKLLCWGEANEWFHVRTPTGAEGWIHASLVR
jgi:hypothetical protein